MGNDEEFFYKKWVQIHTLLGIEPDGDELESLLARWTGPGRFHHGPNHMRQGLIVTDLLGEGYDPKLVAIVGLAYLMR